MAVEHVPAATADAESVAELLRRDGCAVVDDLAPADLLDRFQAEIEPYVAATATGSDEFTGLNTRRTGSLIARSPAARELVQHPLALGVCGAVLGPKRSSYQLHLTQVIAIGAGSPAQLVHRDQWAFDFFPFPTGTDVQVNTIWALTDFTERNGATRVIPGSNRWEDRLRPDAADTEPAEMRRGSVLFYTGSLYHGGGANRSDATRLGINLTYCRSFLRQEENQYLACPPEVARTLDEPLLRLMGYSRGAYALGYVGDLHDPLDVLLGREAVASQSLAV
ncbi:MAG: phytanoyl-CoA dioxygenase family protein [Acidimicrobiales bacterium]|nr:phytanoyl-CoA dioxygenase family protein [Acidimicrobiales bacterium]